ncbi:MAG: hypothetical protein NC909_01040, partial [Candidatus Omnitrophica bacterium]|nr:hypothetical protein [Candidatus Omnitrophota bacterium]
MEEKAFPKEELVLPSRFQRVIQRALVVLKLLLGIMLFPFVYGSTFMFMRELFLLDTNVKISFFSGIAFFLIVYLFIWEPVIIYKKGQRFLQIIFGFFSPLLKIAPYLLPIYTIVLFLLYFLALLIFKPAQIIDIFMFLLGLSISLHLVFSAKILKSKLGDYLKANYIFGFSFIYLINVIILSFGFNLMLKDFSFVNFFNQ